ncbi:MAG TPA: AAA family ATPase [Vicinamibacterales bacterium]|jgi:putative secretion ATPase (PEP-CTERM system associated)
MYERFYHLRDRPFALSPDPDYLYPSRVHREALDYLRFGIEGHAGFVVITGEIGSGKTTLLQVLLRNLDGHTTVVRLVNTLLTGNELLESILLDLGVDDPPVTKPAMLRELARLLIEQRSAGRRVVAVIDEAQNLSHEALEELRMLSNLETEKSKLIQIVLVGQPDLRDSLERPTLEQLRQRVTVRYHINPLDPPDTAHYINHRLKRAAIAAPLEFPRDVTEMIHARSGGVPRLINVICDGVLLCGYAEECRVIDLPLVHAAIEELEASSVLRRAAQPLTAAAREPGDSGSSSKETTPPPQPATPAASSPTPMTFADVPLRRVAEPARPAPAPAPVVKRESVAPRPIVTAAAPRSPIRTVPATPNRAPADFPRQAVAFRSEPARPISAWSRVKEAFFGVRTETGRR